MSAIGKILRKRYITALSIIGVLLFLSQLVVQFTIQQDTGYSTVINIAGKQRMLSQRIAKCVFGINQAKNLTEKTQYLKELQDSVSLWEVSYNELLYGDSSLGLPGDNSPTIMTLYSKINPYYQKIITASKEIIIKGGSDSDITDEIGVIKDNEQSFLKLMDTIVFQYNTEANNNIFIIRTTEIFLMLITFIVLALEVRFIFIPAEQSINRAFNKISENNENIRKLFDITPAALFLIRLPDLKVLQMNELAEQFTRHSIKNNEDFLLKYFEENLENESDLIRKMTKGEPFTLEEAVLKDSIKVVLVSASNICYENTPAIILSMMDISRQKNAELILKKYATIDELTGLLNRRSGKIILDNAVERAKTEMLNLAISFCDIDGLKNVNDTFGHEEGDWYIISIAEAIKANLREDDFAFRYGGDEIIIILNNCDDEKSRTIINRINNTIERKRSEFEKPYNMSVSIGTVHLYSKENTTADDLIAKADNLMYEEKKRKKVIRTK
jgi:diguanylate cyclase (GGDEF) domain